MTTTAAAPATYILHPDLRRFLDGLTPEQRARVANAERWCASRLTGVDGAHDLVGTALLPEGVVAVRAPEVDELIHRLLNERELLRVADVWDRECARFGLARVVAAAQAEAGEARS